MPSNSVNGLSAPLIPRQPCWLEVDLDAVASNVRALKRLVGPTTALAAVVKAEAYGLGAAAVARTAIAAGAEWLAVARVEEGVDLRQAGLDVPILNLAYTAPQEVETSVSYSITPTLVDLLTAQAFSSRVPVGDEFPIHVKLDTGLSRFGALPNELPSLLEGLQQLTNLRLEGIYSHFAAADEADRSFAHEQLHRFHAALDSIETEAQRPRLLHMSNSAATLALPNARLDLVRVGITMAGFYPSPDVPRTIDLQPGASFKARLARTYDLPAGATVGYGRTFLTQRPTRAALVPAGYADGLPRSHSHCGAVLVHGRRAPIIGRVSMDQCVVDITEIPQASAGDEVVLFGQQGSESIALDEYAAWSGTIVHETLCRIGSRVPRYYRTAGQLREVAWLGKVGRLSENAPDWALVAHSQH